MDFRSATRLLFVCILATLLPSAQVHACFQGCMTEPAPAEPAPTPPPAPAPSSPVTVIFAGLGCGTPQVQYGNNPPASAPASAPANPPETPTAQPNYSQPCPCACPYNGYSGYPYQYSGYYPGYGCPQAQNGGSPPTSPPETPPPTPQPNCPCASQFNSAQLNPSACSYYGYTASPDQYSGYYPGYGYPQAQYGASPPASAPTNPLATFQANPQFNSAQLNPSACSYYGYTASPDQYSGYYPDCNYGNHGNECYY